MKRYLMAAIVAVLLYGGSGLGAQAQRLFESTVLRVLTPTVILGYSTSSVAITNPIYRHHQIVRLHCDSDCYVQIGISGTDPVAFASGATRSTFLPADKDVDFIVSGGATIAVIRATADGTLYITEMGR